MNPTRRRRVGSQGVMVKAAHFLGSSAQVMSIADNAALSMGAGVHPTFVLWVYPELAATAMGLMGKGISTAANTEYQFSTNTANAGRFFVSDGTTILNLSQTLKINAWNFLAGYYDGANFGISINNGAFNSFAFTTDIQNGTNAFVLGARSDNSQPFTGSINQVGVAKSVLTAADLTELYNGTRGKNFAQLTAALAAKFVAYYDLDDAGGSGATWLDKAGTNHLTAAAGAAAPTAVVLRR